MTTILHIEDDPFIIRIVEHVLEREGFTVVSANNATLGLESAYQVQPHLILLDVWLPGGESGWEVAQKLRADQQFNNTPIVALTAQNSVRSQEMAHASGCDAFLSKPFEMRRLVECINRLLEKP